MLTTFQDALEIHDRHNTALLKSLYPQALGSVNELRDLTGTTVTVSRDDGQCEELLIEAAWVNAFGEAALRLEGMTDPIFLIEYADGPKWIVRPKNEQPIQVDIIIN